MESRQSIMSQIEDVECFKNCTKLCKPHESNKIMWELYKNKDNLNKKEVVKIQEEIRKEINHPDFI